MREIKFRGKRIDNGEWVYGYYIKGKDGSFIVGDGYYYTEEMIQPEYQDVGMGCGLEDQNITDRYDAMSYGWDKAINSLFNESLPEFVEVDPKTVGQYTGLNDKNGEQEVYECDIIDTNGYIIGNYYENKNLLEEDLNLLIQPITTEFGLSTIKEAMARGCTHSK